MTSRRARWAVPAGGAIRVLVAAAIALSTVAGARGAPPLASRRSEAVPVNAKGPQASVLVRTGDPAPVEARVGSIYYFASLPDGGLVFVTDSKALMLRESGQARILLHVGDDLQGCGNVQEIYEVAAGADGSIASRLSCDHFQAIARIDPAGVAHEVVLKTDMAFSGLAHPISYVYGPVVDGQGRVIASVGSTPDSAAIVRQAKGGTVEVVLKSGDSVGQSLFRNAFFEPAVSAAGTIAFRGRLTGGLEAIVTLPPGGAPEVLIAAPELEEPPSFKYQFGIPTLNDDGVVAFTHVLHWDEFGYPDVLEVMRARDGVVETVVAAGDPAPGGRTFGAIGGPLAVEASGAIVFAARIPAGAGNQGLYRFDGAASVVVEPGQELPDGSHFVYANGLVPRPDGSLLFSGDRYALSPFEDLGMTLFVERDGVLAVETGKGEALSEPARIVDLARGGYPFRHLASGPFMSGDGAVIFDAIVTGRDRSLYARAANGTLTAVAVAGEPAPGGGPFYDQSFAFHSIAAGGRVAFVGSTDWRGPREYSRQLYTGNVGGPLASILVEGDSVPGFDAPIRDLMPPSRIHPDGTLVIPVVLQDERSLLLRWNGAGFEVLAQSGDVLPDGETIEAIRIGSQQDPLAPILADDGAVHFGVGTASGHDAIYRIPPSGTLALATRVVGDGSAVEGQVLQPFLPRALSVDPAGRLAFQAVIDPEQHVATYLAEEGALPRRVAGPGDAMPGGGEVTQALPRLAATAGGIVHSTSMTHFSASPVLWLATDRAAIGNTAAFDQVPLFLGGTPAPDGGTFQGGFGGIMIGPGYGGQSPSPPTSLARIGSDGDRFVASIEATSQGAQILTLFDLRPEGVPPVAAAGSDIVVECAGPLGAMVTLDGSGSAGPSQGGLTYNWSYPFGTATGPTPSLALPLGRWELYLKVTNEQGLSSLDSVIVTVQDTVAPSLVVQATPDVLVPADGRLVPVNLSLTMQDVCDPAPAARLVAVTVDGRRHPGRDVAGAEYGTDDRSILLRARRGPGRTYLVTCVARDRSGNLASGSATVRVPSRPPR